MALTGLEAERSVSDSLLSSGAHRAGGGKVRLADDPSLHNDPSRR